MKNKLGKFVSILAAVAALCALPLAGCDNDNKNNGDPSGGETGGITTPVGGNVDMVSRICIDISDEPLKIPYTTDTGATVSFKSDYSSVAAVDKDGVLYPIAVGVANVTASTSTNSFTFEVEVTDSYKSYTKLRSIGDVEKLIANGGYKKSTNKYCLACDIDFEGATIKPFGAWGGGADGKDCFAATLDGRGYAFKNFVIDPETCTDGDGNTFGVSLFPFVKGGTVRNLNLIGVNFSGYGFTGGVAGQLENGLIENCFVQGKVSATDGFTSSVPSGGICGIMGGKAVVKNCFIDLDVTGGFVFCGFDFGSGSNCAARANSIAAVVNGEELPFQTDDTGNGNPDENKNLKEFGTDTCSLLAETQLTALRNYKFTSDANWAIKRGYMAFVARSDGLAPSWAKISLS